MSGARQFSGVTSVVRGVREGLVCLSSSVIPFVSDLGRTASKKALLPTSGFRHCFKSNLRQKDSWNIRKNIRKCNWKGPRVVCNTPCLASPVQKHCSRRVARSMDSKNICSRRVFLDMASKALFPTSGLRIREGFGGGPGGLGAPFGRLRGRLGPFLAALEPVFAVLALCWPLLGRSWSLLGRSWAALGPLLGSSWGALDRF